MLLIECSTGLVEALKTLSLSHLQNITTEISLREKNDIPTRKMPFFALKSPSKKQQLFFYFMGTFNLTAYDHPFPNQ